MRLQLLSDLHLESDPGYQPPVAAGADVLVLAGDVGSYQTGSRLAGDDFGLARFSPLRGGPWRRVIYLPGNHEYDELPLAETRARLRRLCDELGLIWLDREVLVLDGVRFIGCTLWTDFEALAAAEAAAPPPKGAHLRGAAGAAHSLAVRQTRQRDKALRAADFWLRRHTTRDVDGTPMLAGALRELGLADQAWLREALAAPRPVGEPTVVVTHFAPSLRCADPRYGLVPGTAGFCNALDDLLPHAELWLHGHLHCAIDFVAEGPRPDGSTGRCRVVANPLGYPTKGERDGHRPTWLIDVPGTTAAA